MILWHLPHIFCSYITRKILCLHYKGYWLWVFSEIIAVCSNSQTKPIYIHSVGKMQSLLNVKAGSKNSNHCILKVQVVCTEVHIIRFHHAQFFFILISYLLYIISQSWDWMIILHSILNAIIRELFTTYTRCCKSNMENNHTPVKNGYY
jgi:hypothetical protein